VYNISETCQIPQGEFVVVLGFVETTVSPLRCITCHIKRCDVTILAQTASCVPDRGVASPNVLQGDLSCTPDGDLLCTWTRVVCCTLIRQDVHGT
jgi:hypothetical protein